MRHALGALLLEQGRTDEALAVYDEDLKMWKNNMWGNLGKKLCLEAKPDADKAEVEAAQAAFKVRLLFRGLPFPSPLVAPLF